MTRTTAFAIGAALFALPFLQSGVGDDHRGGDAFHMDHGAHHGGSLLMLGNHHLEVVEKDDLLELYVSDSGRRPIRPAAVAIAFDDGPEQEMGWSSYRMVVDRPRDYVWAEYRIELADGQPLRIRLPAGGVDMAGGMTTEPSPQP